MLYMIRDLVKGNNINWHVGDKRPSENLISTITLIQADGDELEHIRGIFPALTPKTIVAKWCGDIAQTILLNL